jgi:methylated-DNA-[protein]-cysteine S-methyltransferase
MRAIPYGSTRSYADLARDLDSAPRAIGGACGANPIPVIIPCHRVLAAGGRLGGYSGGEGAATKVALLRLEGALAL